MYFFIVGPDLHLDLGCPEKNTAQQLNHMNMLPPTRCHSGRNDSPPNQALTFINEKSAKAHTDAEEPSLYVTRTFVLSSPTMRVYALGGPRPRTTSNPASDMTLYLLGSNHT